MEEAKEIYEPKGDGPMESILIFVGVVFLYFAMQLWILPRFGINT